VGENRRELANPTIDPGGELFRPKATARPTLFNQGVSILDATLAQLDFVNHELARFVKAGTCGSLTCDSYVSKILLVSKPCDKQWRLICDL
jgi:hypothetical protein